MKKIIAAGYSSPTRLCLSNTPIITQACAVANKVGTIQKSPNWSLSNVKRWTSRANAVTHGPSSSTDVHSYREGQLSSFYNQSAIDAVAVKKSVRITPTNLLYMARSPDSSHILRSAQYLQKELPVRVAHRIDGFRHLPFIIGCNPTIKSVHELYVRAFQVLTDFPKINDLESETKYTDLLKTLLDDHKDVVTQLAEGFKECKKHIKDPMLVKNFLDRTLTSRLGIRMLCEHHIALHDPRQDHTGVIGIRTNLKSLVEHCADHVKKTCSHHYGRTPSVTVEGHTHCVFPYISMQEAIGPLEYMIIEILKNSMRATVEAHGQQAELPPIVVTLASNDVDFHIKISDQGGGIPHQYTPHIFNYHFTTATATQDTSQAAVDGDIFGDLTGALNQGAGPMFGYGFGLSISKAYAEYLGGSLTFQTMQGFGTDMYLKLRHIDGKHESFRI